jgi:hypothetical protein
MSLIGKFRIFCYCYHLINVIGFFLSIQSDCIQRVPLSKFQVSINSWRLLIGSQLMLSFRYDIKLTQTEQLPNVSQWHISYILLLLSFD